MKENTEGLVVVLVAVFSFTVGVVTGMGEGKGDKMAEEAKVCEHRETELKYDVDRGGHYVQCRGCGLSGPPQSEEGAAREGWAQMLAWIPKQQAMRAEQEKAFGRQLADTMGLTEGVQGQLDIGKREAAAAERQAAGFERIAAALEKIADKPRKEE